MPFSHYQQKTRTKHFAILQLYIPTSFIYYWYIHISTHVSWNVEMRLNKKKLKTQWQIGRNRLFVLICNFWGRRQGDHDFDFPGIRNVLGWIWDCFYNVVNNFHYSFVVVCVPDLFFIEICCRISVIKELIHKLIIIIPPSWWTKNKIPKILINSCNIMLEAKWNLILN